MRFFFCDLTKTARSSPRLKNPESTTESRSTLLPPAYVVQREGNSFTLLICPQGRGYPYPIMLCNISQNAMGQPPGGGGYPARSSRGGTLVGGFPGQVHPPARSGRGGYPAGGDTQVRYPPSPPARSGWGRGGCPVRTT